MSEIGRLIEKKRAAVSVLRKHRCVLVALSGGVDSAVLLAIAVEALGAENVLAVTGRSAAVTDGEVVDAGEIARTLNVRHKVVETNELDRPGYRANNGDRCFHCRSELFDVLRGVASESGCDAMAYGAIQDDLGDYRPGMDAAREQRVIAPLLESGFRKLDVRALAKMFELHIKDKPASPCLASRIPIGTEVTPERLSQVARAEDVLRALGFSRFRVRHHGDVARIELGEGDSELLDRVGVRDSIVRALKKEGFRFVAVDLEPYRTGSMNPQSIETRLYSIVPHRDGGQ